jgi:hypothetical protein
MGRDNRPTFIYWITFNYQHSSFGNLSWNAVSSKRIHEERFEIILKYIESKRDEKIYFFRAEK